MLFGMKSNNNNIFIFKKVNILRKKKSRAKIDTRRIPAQEMSY